MALASYDPPKSRSDGRWQATAPIVANRLVDALLRSRADFELLTEAFRPVRQELLAPLDRLFRSHRDDVRQMAARILAAYAAEFPELLGELLLEADSAQSQILRVLLKHQPEAVAVVMSGELGRVREFEFTGEQVESLPGLADRQGAPVAPGASLQIRRRKPLSKVLQG